MSQIKPMVSSLRTLGSSVGHPSERRPQRSRGRAVWRATTRPSTIAAGALPLETTGEEELIERDFDIFERAELNAYLILDSRLADEERESL